MKYTTFQDMNGFKVTVQYSGSGDYRIYFYKNEEKPECILLNDKQANILINALRDLMGDQE